jgi:hypothetical protein
MPPAGGGDCIKLGLHQDETHGTRGTGTRRWPW